MAGTGRDRAAVANRMATATVMTNLVRMVIPPHPLSATGDSMPSGDDGTRLGRPRTLVICQTFRFAGTDS
jgi:hypothetical protein